METSGDPGRIVSLLLALRLGIMKLEMNIIGTCSRDETITTGQDSNDQGSVDLVRRNLSMDTPVRALSE